MGLHASNEGSGILKKNRGMMQILVLSAVLVIAGLTIGNSIMNNGEEQVEVGEAAPDFAVVDLKGRVHQLSDYRGQAVIVNFWGTFCKPCVNEMPMMEEYYKKYKDQNLVILGLNLNEPQVTVQSFIREYKITYPILMDDFSVRDRYNVISYPTTFFIDSEGIIQHKFIGEMNESVFRYRLLNILSSTGISN